MKKVDFPYAERVFSIETNDFWFQWCCDCMLRHIWHFRVERGETPDKDRIVITGIDDRIATVLRKRYNKMIKRDSQ